MARQEIGQVRGLQRKQIFSNTYNSYWEKLRVKIRVNITKT